MDAMDPTDAFASVYTVTVTTGGGRHRLLFSTLSSGLADVPRKRNPERTAAWMAVRDGILEDEAGVNAK